MNRFYLMFKDLFSLLIKIALVVIAIWVLVWFLREGTVIIDQGKKHGYLSR